VVELRAHPLRRVVAQRAILRETGGLMIRIVRRIEISEVTADAGRARQTEIVVGMALRTLHTRVRPGQRKSGGRMVEAGPGPLHRSVARRAILWEASRHVVGRGGLLEIDQAAAHTRGVRQGEIVVHVALRTSDCGVRAGQRKSALGVIEGGVLPARSVVAGFASSGKIPAPVIRVRRIRVILQVAARTGRGGARELATDVALHAGHAGVHPGERKCGEFIVIEGRARPGQRGVAERAILWKRRGHVVGILGANEIVDVATVAGGRQARELVSHVALRARQGGVRSGQGEMGKLRVIESGALPDVHVVTALAGRRQPGRYVVQRRARLVILEVA